MVNKHYTVQKQQQHAANAKHFTPPPVRNPSLISNSPNPIGAHHSNENFDFNERRRVDTGREDRKSAKSGNSTYSRNLTIGNKIFGNQSANQDSAKTGSEDPDGKPRFMVKEHLDINDIGRFQYILQMDKEMGKHQPDNMYCVPPRTPLPSSGASSINSTNTSLNFWKAGSESPMTASSSNFRRPHEIICEYLKDIWKYAKWPLLITLCALLLGTSIYFLATDSKTSAKNNPIQSNFIASLYPIDNNSIDAHVVQEDVASIEEFEEEEEITHRSKSKLDTEESHLDKTTSTTSVGSSSSNSITNGSEQERSTNPSSHFRTKEQHQHRPSTHPTMTTTSPSRNTQILQIHTHSGMNFEDDIISTTEMINEKSGNNVEPTKDSFGTIGFTSGHQNNFGIPKEEDERILKLLNEELMRQEQEETTQIRKSTTDASMNHPRVSPTLPVLHRGGYSTTEHYSTITNNFTDVGNCQSTSLSICRGILQYDLTINKTRKPLTTVELEHFKYLFDSKCSSRSAEFVCSALEPECRSSEMGVLRPCKRICKSILEPCASIIASSEILTTTFDCDSYPDSSDRNVCEDPTRRGRCHDNEFQCLDSSCIPLQWKCDNIKDCSLGEDEESCLFCEHEEFRCQTNDKCIPDKWRCDQYNDCPDGSDEVDCYDYEDEAAGLQSDRRQFAFASVQEPNSPKNKPYLTISADDGDLDTDEGGNYDDRYLPTAPSNDDSSEDESGEIQKGEASGRVVVGIVPKNIANFQDSKEIMMTSDSENDFKYSKINQMLQSTTVRTFELTPGPSQCLDGELRCVSGKCITVEQICDKNIDCPDGADEAMCVYKESSSTAP